MKTLRSKFFVAEESDAIYLKEENLPEGFKIINLDGHFFSMVGFLSPDGVAFVADCLSSRETLQKYGIGVVYAVRDYLETLEKIKKLDAKVFVPSHAEPTENITELADYNIKAVNGIIGKITELLKTAKIFEELLKELNLEELEL